MNKRGQSRKKRGQVTIFIIIGLVLIIIIGLYFYLTSQHVEPTVNIPRLAGDSGQVQVFVEGCIDQVAREGLTELGRHGGYIDPTDMTYTLNALDYNALDQSESDMAFLNANDENSGIPYWYYAKSNKDCWHCTLSSQSPSVQLMAYQLGKYVDAHLQECIDNYSSFKAQGFDIKSLTNTTTIVTINDKSVGFLTNYSIQIVRDGETTYIEKFYKDVNVPLLQYYTAAVKITQSEVDTEYLDFYGLYILGQNMGMDSKKLPPFSAYRSGYDSVFWSKTNTRRLYESLLSSYTSFFRINGTDNMIDYTIGGTSLEVEMYKAMTLPIFTVDEQKTLDLKNKEINHIYNGQQIYLNVRPSSGDLISPFVSTSSSNGGILATMEPDQSYEFYYDISYPVIIEIKDSRPGNEYSFMFALQGNIKENKLLSDWVSGLGTMPWSYDYVKMNTNIPVGTETQDLATGEVYTYEAPQTGKILFCDAEQRLSGNIKAKTYDSYTSLPLDGVTVSYHCGTYAECYVGETKYNSTLKEVSFNDKLPLCTNGYIQFDKSGYLSKRMPLTTEYQKSQSLGAVYMEQIYTKNVTVIKYPVYRNSTLVLGDPSNLSDTDTVTISLRKITLDNWDELWTQTMILGKDGTNTTTVQLVPGMYVVDANLMDYNGVIIPKECQEIKKPGKNIWIPSEDIKIDVAMWGGISFDEQNPFVLTAEDLMSNDSIQFNVVRMPDPRCLNDMNVIDQIGSISGKYKAKLYPKLVP